VRQVIAPERLPVPVEDVDVAILGADEDFSLTIAIDILDTDRFDMVMGLIVPQKFGW
jgi:hypothetical protein